MLVTQPTKPIKVIPIILNGYVSKYGNGISITQKTAEATQKLRIFSNGKAEELFHLAKDTFTIRKQLLPNDTFKFHQLLKKYNTPGALDLHQITDIYKKFFKHIEKCGCRNKTI